MDLANLGIKTEAKLVMPGVYEAVLENLETVIGMEAYIVQRSADEISAAAKEYGKAVPDYPELLVYSEDATGNTMYIIGYELFRYKALNHFPLPEDETIRSIAAIGAEMYPGYFGLPCPLPDPMGLYHAKQDHRQRFVLDRNRTMYTRTCCGLPQIR